ncbi:MAG: DUF4153 domain-containing protein [Alphaproteobacteria bacterium]
MTEDLSDRYGPLFRWVLAGAGLLQGLGYYILVEMADDAVSTALVATMVFLLVAPLSFQLSYGLGQRVRVAAAGIGFGLLASLLWVWLDIRVDGESARPASDEHLFTFIWTMTGGAYIILPFIQTWLSEGGFRFPYPPLFRFSWNNILVAAIAGTFLGVFWLVLLLWWSLFELVGVSFFYDLFTEPLFAWAFSGGVLGLGIAIARENDRIVPTFRRVVLTLFQVLAPVLAVAALLFLVFLPFTGLDPLWETRRATPILVALMFAVVLSVNAVIQDGSLDEPKNRVIAWLIAAALLLLPVYAGLAFYATSLRIDQYGITPDRYIARLIVIVAAAHVVLYAVAVAFRRLSWSDWVCRANPALAAIVALIALLLQTPVLDPYRSTANDQLARLLDGRADAETFDYAFLHFKLGQSGREALADLDNLDDHPNLAQIKAGLAEARDADFYYQVAQLPPSTSEQARQTLILRPETLEVSDALWKSLERHYRWQLERCAEKQFDCGLLGLDTDSDGALEYFFLNSSQGNNVFALDGEGKGNFVPRRTGPLNRTPSGGGGPTLWDSFVAGDYELVEPRHLDIRIGEEVLSY